MLRMDDRNNMHRAAPQEPSGQLVVRVSLVVEW